MAAQVPDGESLTQTCDCLPIDASTQSFHRQPQTPGLYIRHRNVWSRAFPDLRSRWACIPAVVASRLKAADDW